MENIMPMVMRSSFFLVLLLGVLAITSFIFFIARNSQIDDFYAQESVKIPAVLNENNIFLGKERRRIVSFNKIQEDFRKNRFKFDGKDVLIFLHIQKTAGTSFERFLVKNLQVTNPCICNSDGRKRCNCRTPNGKVWLFSRYSTGWVDWACGLHADYTQLIASGCIDYYFKKKEGMEKKRLYLTTFLREPIDRFISEYSHVQRGATWNRSRHFCNGRPPTPKELPMCFDSESGWKGVGIDEFLACPHNMAFNRQARMLADLTLVNCYKQSSMDEETRNKLILESAKKNLQKFAFFGIKEMMAESQILFEKTFGFKFSGDLSHWNKSKSSHIAIAPKQMELIRRKNQLDLALYEFAQKLFETRMALF